MSNLQVKGVDEKLYAKIKGLAAAENRSVSQQILYLAREYLARREKIRRIKSPGEVLLDLSGSWEDDRSPEAIAKEIHQSRKNSTKFREPL